ncbi:TPA: O-acetyl-ADP-ribose deacetylase [bacterium]|nr:O-acetyl-ADP-ribose deacetylase [bacterium]
MERIKVVLGDITEQKVDVIVNAANPSLMGGGGVDGAIHRKGGPSILEECKQIIKKIGHLATGKAVITKGGNLPAKYVIHTVGPIWGGGSYDEEEVLRSSYQESLRLAKENNLKRVAFPSISTGAYGYPKELAAPVAVSAVSDFLDKNPEIDEVRFVLFNNDTYSVYENALKRGGGLL